MKLSQKILEEIIKPENSLGIERKDMPQINADKIEAFTKYLKSEGVDFERIDLLANQLTPSQNELDTDKADKMYQENIESIDSNDNPLRIPLIVSQDKYVLDGHHRWLAFKRNDSDKKMPCIMMGPNAKECLEIMHKFEGVEKRNINDEEVKESKLASVLLEEIKKDSRFAIFTYKDMPNLESFHTTLMYFGEMSEESEKEVINIIDKYFGENEPKMFEATFDKEAMFGPNEDVRVLLTENKDRFLPDLRAKLEKYNGSKFKEFKPHLTTDLNNFTGTVDKVMFSSNGYKVIKEWFLS